MYKFTSNYTEAYLGVGGGGGRGAQGARAPHQMGMTKKYSLN